uniref:Single domain-containing protein n=1 Tax=Amblyomma parvum TaxID=251391 RepID=A0A023G0I5_AMBPA
MSKILVTFLLLAAALDIQNTLCEETTVTSLRFHNGTCIYRNVTIKQGASDVPSDLCELWECNARERKLTVLGCYIPRRYGSCFHHSRFGVYWPTCCGTYQPYC